MDYLKAYKAWVNDGFFDDDTKQELKLISSDDKEIKERFYKDLEFGTGGLRGIIGAGTNRMNIYTVRKAAQGFANYLNKQDFNGKKASDMGVCIAFDSRRMSPKFASETAQVMCANGIKAYIFEDLRPTPELSFAVRHLGCCGGVVITASHNPPEYNGFKVYGDDGGQVTYPRDEEIIEEVNKVTDFSKIPSMDVKDAEKEGLYITIGKDVDEAYYNVVLSQMINKDMVEKHAGDIRIVYTPLNGAGNIPVNHVLSTAGFRNVFTVKEQQMPDSNFTTVGYPNPEDVNVFKLAIKLAKEKDANLLIATDPDSDRVGIMVKDNKGEFFPFTGNMTGFLLAEYILSQKSEKGILPQKPMVISTIVSSRLTKVIAENYGVGYTDVLTGFKFIGDKIRRMEETCTGNYVFGFEESIGYLPGTYARDKDAVASALLICEMAVFYMERNMSLYDALISLYEKYGYYKESTHSIAFKGIEGAEHMKKIMEVLKANPPLMIGGKRVVKLSDYNASVDTDMETGKTAEITLPKSNVLYYTTEDSSWICVRPSGTEPKIKIYFGVKGENEVKASEKLENVVNDTMNIINGI
ncbi:MAG: phospho-sugar mutase [Clostridiales bacterium]|jgi:phosphoglucomutase|nr:phospho-sugar mutase [Clostridiales bacterium]